MLNFIRSAQVHGVRKVILTCINKDLKKLQPFACFRSVYITIDHLNFKLML